MSDFYNTRDLSFETRKNIIIEAWNFATKCFINELDCEVSFSRTPSQTTLSEFLEIMKTNHYHFAVINRGFDQSAQARLFEIGVRVFGDKKDLFLFCFIPEQMGLDLVNKYDLRI